MANWYNSGLQKILNGTVDLDTSDLDVILCTSSYTFDDEHDFVEDLTNELSGGNYARTDLSGADVTVDDTNNGATFDATDTTFTSLGAAAGTPAHAIVFVNVGSAATDILVCRIPLPGTVPDGNNYVIQWHADGVGYWRNGGTNPYWYNQGIVDVMDGAVDLINDTLNVALVTSSYTFNDEHDVIGDITNELSGGNYARVALTSNGVTLDDTNNGAYFDAADTTFPSLGAAAGTPAAAIIYSDTHASDRLLFYVELTTPDTPDGNNYVINWAAGGIATVQNT